MRNPLIRMIGLFVLLLSFQSANGEIRDPEQHFFSQSLGDFSEELEMARDENKKGILLMFEMDECPFCHRMKTTILNQSEVQEYFRKHFLIFAVDIEGDIEIVDFKGKETIEKDFAFKQNRVRATPVFAFFDLQGDRVARYTGATANQQEFMLLGQYVVEGLYKKMSFAKYKRSLKNNHKNM